MKFPYKNYPNGKGGFDSYAVIEVNLSLPGKDRPRSKRFEALIDSGTGRCIFLCTLGRAIGLDVENGEVEQSYGISGTATVSYLHDIHLYAPSGVIAIRAAFTENLPVAGILGMRGFFEHFKVTFDPIAQRCELERIHRA